MASTRRSRLLPKPPKDNAAYVLALDLSLNRPGYAVLRVTDTDVTLASCGHLAVKVKRGRESTRHGERLREIRDWITDTVRNFPQVERVFAKEDAPPSAVTGAILNRVHGVAQEALADFAHVDIPQATVKMLVVGRGGSDVTKGEVEAAVRELLRLPSDFKFDGDDESDACAVGLAYLALQERLPADGRFDAMRLRVVAHKAKAARKKSQGKRKGRAA